MIAHFPVGRYRVPAKMTPCDRGFFHDGGGLCTIVLPKVGVLLALHIRHVGGPNAVEMIKLVTDDIRIVYESYQWDTRTDSQITVGSQEYDGLMLQVAYHTTVLTIKNSSSEAMTFQIEMSYAEVSARA